MALQQRLQTIVSGLKSKNEQTRGKTAQDLQHFVATELREATSDQYPELMDNLVHCIYDLVNSTDVNEKKGGILAIGKDRKILCDYTFEFSYFAIFSLLFRKFKFCNL